jgi:hypothetical protein
MDILYDKGPASVPDPWYFSADPDPWTHAFDLWIRIQILDPDPAVFFINLQNANKKLIFVKSLSSYYFLKVHLHNFSNIKSPKEIIKQ